MFRPRLLDTDEQTGAVLMSATDLLHIATHARSTWVGTSACLRQGDDSRRRYARGAQDDVGLLKRLRRRLRGFGFSGRRRSHVRGVSRRILPRIG